MPPTSTVTSAATAPAAPAADTGVLVVARRVHPALQRRSRRFTSADAADQAIARWAAEGFDVFWTQDGTDLPSAPFRLHDGHRVPAH